MSTPEHPRFPKRPRIEQRYESLNMWRAVRLVAAVALTIMLVAALLERLVEPEEFTSYPIALWWSVVTVATVGYGDFVPHTGIGRMVAAGTIVFSMALIPTVTSLIVAALVTKVQRQVESAQDAQLDEIVSRLEAIERKLDERR
jgi:voltage-gated potassium channel